MYAKHNNLVDVDASGAKSGKKYLSSILGLLKSRRGPAQCIIMCALESEILKERFKHVHF